MNIIYHLGVHKTGTSFIQKMLKKNKRRLKKKGYYVVYDQYLDVAKFHRFAQRAHIKKRKSAQKKWEKVAELNREILDRAKACGAHTILFSDENRIGPPIYTELKSGKNPASFYGQAKDLMERFIDGFGEECDIKFVLYSRSHTSFLASLYGEALRRFAIDITLDDFCDSIDLPSFSYSRLARDLSKIENVNEVSLRRFEIIKEGSQAFLEDFCNEAGLDPNAFLLPTQVERAGVGEKGGLELLELIRAREAGVMNVRQFKKEASKIITREAGALPRIKLPEGISNTIRQSTQDDEMELRLVSR